MKIDIEPIVEIAHGIQAIAMEMDNETERYVVRYANGKDYSVVFNKQRLDDFCPSKNVSEMLVAWTEGLQREYDTAKTVVETGFHPTWMNRIPDPNAEPWERKTISIPYKLSDSAIESWKLLMKRCEANLGQVTFHKLIRK